jgi:hypothetical protein
VLRRESFMHMRMPKCSKRRSKFGMTRGYKREFKQGYQVLFFNSCFNFSTGKLISRWSKPYEIQEVYRSGALRLKGDIKGKPHIVNGQHLKHYFAGENFVGNVE